MNKDKRYIPDPDDETGEIQFQIIYRIGGMNYFSGVVEERGYELFITPVHRSTSGYTMELSSSRGYRVLIEKTRRYSKKKFNEIVKKFNSLSDKELKDLYYCRDIHKVREYFNTTSYA